MCCQLDNDETYTCEETMLTIAMINTVSSRVLYLIRGFLSFVTLSAVYSAEAINKIAHTLNEDMGMLASIFL